MRKDNPLKGLVDTAKTTAGTTRYNIETHFDSKVSISPESQQEPETLADIPPEPVQKMVVEILPELDELPVEETIARVISEPESFQGKPKKPLSKAVFWICLAAMILAILLGLFFFFGIKNARQWKNKVSAKLRGSQKKRPSTLVAKFNGQSYQLGNPDRLNTINIGSGLGNTVRIPDKSISDKHVKIYRKGSNLMLQNIGTTPIAVNNSQLKPRGRQRLVIPSVIQLNDKTRINLMFLKPTTNSPENRSTQNEIENR
ncbi:MAG TPA: FHA domain-containing protein [Phycisphaerales bacterium]|nr:FHA domain-containing protein [Phycisphaerales bacterium]